MVAGARPDVVFETEHGEGDKPSLHGTKKQRAINEWRHSISPVEQLARSHQVAPKTAPWRDRAANTFKEVKVSQDGLAVSGNVDPVQFGREPGAWQLQ
jgi:hypothetical protein